MAHTFSVIVPVHNEADILARTIPCLLEDLGTNAHLIYVCNGCTDNSQETIRALAGERAEVIVTKTKGKPNAIRLGEAAANNLFPRFFVDADVVITGRSLQLLAAELASPGTELVSPSISLSTIGCSFMAASIANTWQRLPYLKTSAFRLVIGISKVGRSRWADLPDIIADDTFMALQVPPARRRIIPTVTSIEQVPRTFWSFVGVRARWLMGDWQLQKMGLRPNHPSQWAELLGLLVNPRTAMAAAIYVLHRALASALARWWMISNQKQWFRDHTSRRT